jgi:hypothetical protein
MDVLGLFIAGLAVGIWATQRAKALAAFGPIARNERFRKRNIYIAAYIVLSAACLTLALITGLRLIRLL